MLGACKIEPTPARYIDRPDRPAAEAAEARAELVTRLASIGPALSRGSRTDIQLALAPHAEIRAYAMDAAEVIDSGNALVSALERLAGDAAATPADVTVEVGPGQEVAWFRSRYPLEAGEGVAMMTGVFRLRDGEWRLVQAHISRLLTPMDPPPAASVDTVAAAG